MTKIHLSNPEYQLDKTALERDAVFIKGQQYGRAIRRRVPFFMDGYRYAAAAVKKRWGIDFCFFEAGHEQVKPCYPPSLLSRRGGEIWWKKMNEDAGFAAALVKEVRNIVIVEKKLVKSIPQRILSPKEVEKFLFAHLAWWVKFFEAAYLWFGVDDIKEKIDQEIRAQWNGNKKPLQTFIESVYRPMYLPLSSVEQRDLLKLHSLYGSARERALKKHWKVYRHLSLHTIDDEYFNTAYYRDRLKVLQDDAEYKKTKAMLDAADKEMRVAGLLVKKVQLPEILKEHINFVRWFMYIRTETVDHFMLVNGAYKPVFASLSRLFDLPMDALLHMTYEELIAGARKGKLSVSRDMVLERTKNGYAYLVATPPHASYLVTGEEADWLHAFVMPEQKSAPAKELKGQTAFKGVVRGIARVILDRRDAHDLKAGEILVTTMTSPEFVPAMKLSGGIITNEGGILCHAAIMSRELRKPCVIGTKIATDVIKTGQTITLDADTGIITLL